MFALLSSCYDNSADQGTDIQTAESVPAALREVLAVEVVETPCSPVITGNTGRNTDIGC